MVGGAGRAAPSNPGQGIPALCAGEGSSLRQRLQLHPNPPPSPKRGPWAGRVRPRGPLLLKTAHLLTLDPSFPRREKNVQKASLEERVSHCTAVHSRGRYVGRTQVLGPPTLGFGRASHTAQHKTPPPPPPLVA